MSEIKTLDNLRDSLIGYQAVTGEDMGAFLLHADEIEAEIAERYMLLPVDVAGVPIHVGDVVEYENPNDDDKPFTILGVNNDGDVFHCLEDKQLVPTCISLANCLRHVKPDPLKELLEDFVDTLNSPAEDDGRDFCAEYAEPDGFCKWGERE